jgi:DNA-binding transcriptional ArsR family regulator
MQMIEGSMRREDADVCEIYYVNEAHVRSARQALSPEREILSLAEAFRTLGDPTRVKILQALSVEELCVCDLAKLLGISESATSHQLRVLRSQKLVRFRKEGKMAFYSLDDAHIDVLMNVALRHVREGAGQVPERTERVRESAG